MPRSSSRRERVNQRVRSREPRFVVRSVTSGGQRLENRREAVRGLHQHHPHPRFDAELARQRRAGIAGGGRRHRGRRRSAASRARLASAVTTFSARACMVSSGSALSRVKTDRSVATNTIGIRRVATPLAQGEGDVRPRAGRPVEIEHDRQRQFLRQTLQVIGAGDRLVVYLVPGGLQACDPRCRRRRPDDPDCAARHASRGYDPILVGPTVGGPEWRWSRRASP